MESRTHEGDVSWIQSILDRSCRTPKLAQQASSSDRLLALLGSADPFLRESSLDILWTWSHNSLLSGQQLARIGDRAAANLSVGLGKCDTDSVFLRSFSFLVLGMVVKVDSLAQMGLHVDLAPFLRPEQLLAWLDLVLESLLEENDMRGFIPGKGWAHATSHAADALRHVAQSRLVGRHELKRILDATADRLQRPSEHVYAFNEVENLMSDAYVAILRDLIPLDELRAWIRKRARRPDGRLWESVFSLEACDLSTNNARVNTCMALRCFHLLLVLGARGASESDGDQRPYFEFLEQAVPHKEALLREAQDALRSTNRELFGDVAPPIG